jgi:small GTP-binding protein
MSSCCYYSEDNKNQNSNAINIVDGSTLDRRNPKLTYKISILGNAGCGKTTLMHRLVHGIFPKEQQPTPACYCEKYTAISGDQLNTQKFDCIIWDTAGQEKYGALVPIYIRESDICIICFSLENGEQSKQDINKWIIKAKINAPSAKFLFVGTKADLCDGDNVENTGVFDWIEDNIMNTGSYIVTSSVTGHGIDSLSESISNTLVLIS